MQKANNYSEILATINTKEDVNLLIEEIDLLINSIYHKDNDFEDILKSKIRKNIAAILSTSLTEVSDKEAFLRGLRQSLAKLDYIKLTIAFEPSQKLVDKIASWIHQNIGQLILDLELDPQLLGGAIIEYKGKYIDLSLKGKLESYAKV